MKNPKEQKRIRHHKKIRSRLSGTAERPRLSVYKSNTALFAQVIDDVARKTIVGVRGKDPKKLGTDVAKLAMGKKIETVVFDRGGYVYTGKVRALAEAAREAGLKF